MVSESRDPAATTDCTLEGFIADYVEVLDWSKVRYLLGRQRWSVREKGWRTLVQSGGM